MIAKPRPKLLEKREAKAQIDATDRAENEKARRRANGRCEIFVVGEGWCTKRDQETHHMISGIGRKKVGRSLLAEHKQRCCTECHRLITNNVLKVLTEGRVPRWNDPYERIWT